MASAAEPAEASSDLVRVTVASTRRRVDLLLPGSWPVADLLPELARSVGVLDRRTAHAGYRLVTAGGRALDDHRGLVEQRVSDGAILTVVSRDLRQRPVHDDPAEAMGEAVRSAVPPWRAQDGRRAAQLAVGLFLFTGAQVAGLAPSSPPAAGAVAVAGVLTGAGIALARAGWDGPVPLTLACVGTVHAGAAGLVVADHLSLEGHRITHAAVGAAVAGAATLVGLPRRRALALPAVIGGAALAGAGALTTVSGLTLPVVLAGLLTLLVAAGAAAPRVASTAMRGQGGGGLRDGPDAADSSGVDAAGLVTDVRLAEELIAALSATAGLLLVGAAPVVATLRPPAGAALALLCCTAQVLRSRRLRSRVLVGLLLALGTAGVVATVVTVAVRQPELRPAAAGGLTLLGLLLVPVARTPTWLTERWPRLLDAVEALVVVALVPTALTAVGVGPWLASAMRP